MSNRNKRAQRSKLKAKNHRIAKQKQNAGKHNKEEQDLELSEETLALFQSMPSPQNESACLECILSYLQANESLPESDVEDSAKVLFYLYQKWHSEQHGDV